VSSTFLVSTPFRFNNAAITVVLILCLFLASLNITVTIFFFFIIAFSARPLRSSTGSSCRFLLVTVVGGLLGGDGTLELLSHTDEALRDKL
jgi:hypothetical protein